mmetsp:Transcript_16393/g.41998  ORF Transcript_16393/g.41998 Transcript_16393/m.41998 type:complete len:316 (-) Transcript_16393:261-1208(-)
MLPCDSGAPAERRMSPGVAPAASSEMSAAACSQSSSASSPSCAPSAAPAGTASPSNQGSGALGAATPCGCPLLPPGPTCRHSAPITAPPGRPLGGWLRETAAVAVKAVCRGGGWLAAAEGGACSLRASAAAALRGSTRNLPRSPPASEWAAALRCCSEEKRTLAAASPAARPRLSSYSPAHSLSMLWRQDSSSRSSRCSSNVSLSRICRMSCSDFSAATSVSRRLGMLDVGALKSATRRLGSWPYDCEVTPYCSARECTTARWLRGMGRSAWRCPPVASARKRASSASASDTKAGELRATCSSSAEYVGVRLRSQ